jgi:hypothetical protein
MPEQSMSRSKYNYNKYQKDKQNKVLQYYRRSFKSQLAPAREITRPRKTRKQPNQYNQSIANGTGRIPKLTKMQSLEKESAPEISNDKKIEQNALDKSNEKTIEKPETSKQPTQNVIMD